MNIPHVSGALVTGPAAYALSRVLSRDDLEEQLRERGYGTWLPQALAAWDVGLAASHRPARRRHRAPRDHHHAPC